LWPVITSQTQAWVYFANQRKNKMRNLIAYTLVGLFLTPLAIAQNQNLILGQSSQLSFPVPKAVGVNKCHIEVVLPNQQKIGVEVEGPDFNATLTYIPDQIGNSTLKWEGVMKRRGLNSVIGCSGSGTVQLSVSGNAEFISQQWSQYFQKASDTVAECVKIGMDLSQLRYQPSADPSALLTSPNDPKMKPIYEKCDSFIKMNQPRIAAPCTLQAQNNLRTLCDGVYAERQADGKLNPISRTAAISLHLQDKPWVVAIAENADARTSRIKQEEELKLKEAAAIALQKENEEKERRFRASPEFKKQQAELIRKEKENELQKQRQAKIEEREAAEELKRQARAPVKCWVNNLEIKSCDPVVAATQLSSQWGQIRVESKGTLTLFTFQSESHIVDSMRRTSFMTRDDFKVPTFINKYVEKGSVFEQAMPNGCIISGEFIIRGNTKNIINKKHAGSCERGQIMSIEQTIKNGGETWYAIK
jgi:hypothetical protein